MTVKPTYEELERRLRDLEVVVRERKASAKYLEGVINNIGDPLFVKDDQSRLLMVNDSFCTLFGLAREHIIGKTLVEKVPPNEQESFLKIDREVIATGVENITEESLTVEGQPAQTIHSRKTRFIGDEGEVFLIGVIRDITERKLAEDKRVELIDELKRTLSEVKTLQGYLPICAHCKNIRDDKGYWNRIEAYISEHSDAVFSHSVCPDCVQQHYSDILDDQ